MREMFDMSLVVTSILDGVHSEGSKHYTGNAFDIRTWVLSPKEKEAFATTLSGILDPMGYDVVLETDHVHVEYDPKKDEAWFKYLK